MSLWEKRDMVSIEDQVKVFTEKTKFKSGYRSTAAYVFDSIYHVARFCQVYKKDLAEQGFDIESETPGKSLGDWSCHVSPKRLMDSIMAGGDPGLVKDLEAQFKVPNLESVMDLPEQAVTGGAVLIPEYVIGVPECMYGVTQDFDHRGHLNIFAGLLPGSDMPSEVLAKRNGAILFLAKHLASIRPVTLWGYISTDLCVGGSPGGAVAAFKLATQPLNVAECAIALHPAFVRGMLPQVMKVCIPCSYGLPWPFRTSGEASTHEGTKKVLESTLFMDDEDLFIPEPPKDDLMMADPERWVEVMIRHFTGLESMSDDFAKLGTGSLVERSKDVCPVCTGSRMEPKFDNNNQGLKFHGRCPDCRPCGCKICPNQFFHLRSLRYLDSERDKGIKRQWNRRGGGRA
jgi:hypothetical protein